MGMYMCVLNNTSGKVSVRGFLEVTEAPHFIMQPENISAFEEDINIELQCQATGSPKPEVGDEILGFWRDLVGGILLVV